MCTHVHYNRELLTLCSPAAITSAFFFFFFFFIPFQFVLSWLGGVPFEKVLVSRAYLCFVEACKRDCGRRK